jgi:hypothetical protein
MIEERCSEIEVRRFESGEGSDVTSAIETERFGNSKRKAGGGGIIDPWDLNPVREAGAIEGTVGRSKSKETGDNSAGKTL